jgi:hypothetical protein
MRTVPVRAASKRRLRYRLYEIALMFRREKDYDFVQWDETSDDGHGYLLVDADGRALGGAVVRWREYKVFTLFISDPPAGASSRDFAALTRCGIAKRWPAC